MKAWILYDGYKTYMIGERVFDSFEAADMARKIRLEQRGYRYPSETIREVEVEGMPIVEEIVA